MRFGCGGDADQNWLCENQTAVQYYIYVWLDGRYRSKVLLSTIPTPGPGFEVKSMDLIEFSCKTKTFCTLVYITILSRPCNEFHVYLAWW